MNTNFINTSLTNLYHFKRTEKIMRIQTNPSNPFTEVLEKVENSIKTPTVSDETLFQETLQLLTNLEAHIQKTVHISLKLVPLQLVRDFSGNVQFLFKNKKLRSDLPALIASTKIMSNDMSGLFAPTSKEEKDLEAGYPKLKRKDVFASFAAEIEHILKLINEKRIENIVPLMFDLLTDIFTYASTEMPSGEGKWIIMQVEFFLSVIMGGMKYKLLTKDPISDILLYFKYFFKNKNKINLILQIARQGIEKNALPTSQRDKIWQIIHNEIKRDIDLVICMDSFSNTVYQTRQLVNEETANKIIAAFNKEDYSAFKIPSKKEGWFYICIPFDASRATEMVNTINPINIEQNVSGTSKMKYEYKENKENKDISIGKEIIEKLRSTLKIPADILPAQEWPEEIEIIQRRKNKAECLEISREWQNRITEIAKTTPRITHFNMPDNKKLELIQTALKSVTITTCGFGDHIDLAAASFYECAKKNIFPLEIVQIARDEQESRFAHIFVLAKRDGKKSLQRLKDMDVLNKEAFVVDPFFKLTCSAQNYRLQTDVQKSSFDIGYSKEGKINYCFRLENEAELKMFINCVERIEEWVTKNKRLLPKQRPPVKFLQPPTINTPNLLTKVMVLFELIQVHTKLEQSKVETAALIDSLPPFRLFGRPPKIDKSFDWVNYLTFDSYMSDEASLESILAITV